MLGLWTILHGGHCDGEAHLDRSWSTGAFLSALELIHGLGLVESGGTSY